MLARTTRYGENLRDYYYDKLTLMNRCEIYGKKAVDCIIHGITDKSIRNGAQALSCSEPDDLLNFLNSQKPLQASIEKRTENTPHSRFINNTASTSASGGLICFNCKNRGHPFWRCPSPMIKCQKCARVGHDDSSCKLSPLPIRTDAKPAPKEER